MRITARVEIAAPPAAIWKLLVNPEAWWVASNPEEHESLRILGDDRRLRPGTQLRIREKVAGIPCVAEGPIRAMDEGRRLSWSAHAVYRLLGVRFPIEEGVTWRVRPLPAGSELSAHVWADFPADWRGRLARWLFLGPLRGERRDRQHAMKELRYLKQRVEAEAAEA